ncbi:small distal tail fiber subunit [Cronobacter phage vB_CsaM_leE]|uniref:Long tail fiber protein Gp37 n=1 Tax=Cronobacter phage vB_CsaM_leE TaxID=1873954 RepID=A0A1W5P105_9CAUD|nr:long tail fiber protein distal subunit [Cronobacter phage vB_CsaM_leE]AON97281.1 small distal tail fiber subunit [Cronobacter phage vB_CsaM_leE]
MADLKLGTTLGGAGIWSASNLPLLPSGGQLTYKGWRVYTENDRPTAEDINALSMINGGTVAKNTTFSQNVTVGVQLTATVLQSNQSVGITRSAAAPVVVFRRPDITGVPGSESGLMDINAYNGISGGQLAGAINVNARTDGGNKVYIRAFKDGTQNTLISLDSQTQQVTVEQGSFRVIGTSNLGVTNAASLAVTGAMTANTITPTNWSNHDERYITGIPRGMSGTSFGAAIVTEKNDVLSVGGNVTDGPYGNTTYYGQVVNYRRTLNTGVSLVQTYFGNEMWVRLGSGSPGAWSWNQGDANGWRRVYDTVTPPTPAEVGAVSRTGDAMTGQLWMSADISMRGTVSRHFRFEYLKNDGTTAVDAYIYKDGVDNTSRRPGVRINCGTPNRVSGNTSNSGDFVFGEDGTFTLPGGGMINQDGLNQNVYCMSALSTTSTGSKNYLRRFRGGSGDVIFHETAQGNTWRIASGSYDAQDEMVLSTAGSGWVRYRGEVVSQSANGLRIAYGNVGSFIRSDGNNTYFLLTNSGDVYGTYNGLRPIYFSNTTGNVTMGHTLSVGGRISQSNSYIDNGLLNLNGSGDSQIYFTRSGANPRDMRFFHSGDATRGNRIELADTTSYLVYFERHPSSGIQLVMNGNGSFNDVYIRSDERLKSNFGKIENALDKVELLNGVVYDKANHIGGDETTREAGLIAQQLQAVLPEAVKNGVDGEQNEILTISPVAVIALLVNAVKELREEVRELKSR